MTRGEKESVDAPREVAGVAAVPAGDRFSGREAVHARFRTSPGKWADGVWSHQDLDGGPPVDDKNSKGGQWQSLSGIGLRSG